MFQDETDSIAETDSDRDRDRDVKSAMDGGNIEREGAINLTHSRPSSVSGVSNSQHNDMEHEVSIFSYIIIITSSTYQFNAFFNSLSFVLKTRYLVT